MSTPSLPKQLLTEIALESIKKIQQPLLLYGIVESVLLIILIVMGRDVPSGLLPIVYTLAAMIVLIAIGHFLLEFNREYSKRKRPLPKKEVTPPPSPRVYKESDSSEFQKHARDLALKANRIVLIGTGLNILRNEPFLMKLMTRAAQRDCQLEIYLADPFSPAVEMRLIEEELGTMKPPVGQDGLLNLLGTLRQKWKDFGRPKTISIQLFTNYPTFALMILDQKYFIYPYGYATLGNFSPVFQFSKDEEVDKDVIPFLDEQYRRIKESALDAETTFEIRSRRDAAVEKLHPFTLYFVPPRDSGLYRFGTEVLGYDVRQRMLKDTPLQNEVGSARVYGFHLTLCDVVYFMNKHQLESVWKELEFLAREFEPFDITDLQVQRAFPDSSSFSVVVKDPSGCLEALHHELVHRVYRRAVASNYSLGLAKLVRDQDFKRTELMIKRYRAPYILQRFRPHFTLLTNVQPENQSHIYDRLREFFEKEVPERTIRVDRLAVMSLPAQGAPWEIKGEIVLGAQK